jgi:hypothetical protein
VADIAAPSRAGFGRMATGRDLLLPAVPAATGVAGTLGPSAPAAGNGALLPGSGAPGVGPVFSVIGSRQTI